jgi:hypothetical protein
LTEAIACVAVGGCMAACNPKPDLDTRCHDIVAHMRKVSTMPMRDGDVGMFMGACMMWKPPMLACMEETKNDADIATCRQMDAH